MTAPVREDIAALLRAGVPYSKIRTQLHVSNDTIITTRKAIGMAPGGTTFPDGRPKTDDERRADITRRHTRAATMLRAGASYREIRAELGISPGTISNIRRTLDIPSPRTPRPVRTPAEALALYSTPHADGHTHWTGPRTGGGNPQLWADGRSYSPLRIAFHLHHGREPQGRVRTDCDDPKCITGAHLADRRLREANHRADTAFEQIFGSPS